MAGVLVAGQIVLLQLCLSFTGSTVSSSPALVSELGFTRQGSYLVDFHPVPAWVVHFLWDG